MNRLSVACACLVVTVAGAARSIARDTPPSMTAALDIDKSGMVDAADVAAVLAGWGGNADGLDFDGDGRVGTGDLGIVVAALGTSEGGDSDSGDTRGRVSCEPVNLPLWSFVPLEGFTALQILEAEVIAVELLGPSDPLRADPALVMRMASDIAAIREADSLLAITHHEPMWRPGFLNFFVNPAIYPSTETQCLDSKYHPVLGVNNPYENNRDFEGPVNILKIAQQYLSAPDVYAAYVIEGIDGPKFYPEVIGETGTSIWTVERRFGEFCDLQCECVWTYRFLIPEGGDAQLLSFTTSGAYAYCQP